MGKGKTIGILTAIVLIAFLLFFSKTVLSLFQESGKAFHIYDLEARNHCALPLADGYKAWRTGVITTLGAPIIKDCPKIIAGDKEESKRLQRIFQWWLKTFKRRLYSDEAYTSLLQQSSNCTWLKESIINNLYNTKLERDFPIAYVFLVYESPLQFLRLLKILYKPQNWYCIHADEKSPFKKFFNNIIQCFDNVIAPSKSFDVQWGHFSILEAQMQCFTDLVNLRQRQAIKKKWNYVVNLCGKELPLHSTNEMVQMMQSLMGTSSIVASPISKKEWWTMKRLRGRTIPFNLKFYKSMAYNALSADFATFMVKDFKSKTLLQFFKNTNFPEEHYYPVLFHMPHVPGGYHPGIPRQGYFEVSHYFWRNNKAKRALPCFGITVHQICIVNHFDLPHIMRETNNGDTALFQNKYFMEKNHIVMDCMEEMIVAKNKLEYKQDCQSQGDE